ncbi:hypothetical protein OPV22_006041 [Ensete ventricosum]|uniref:Uncharacterized protein n=1 Tax=Ensete ventricosum TaxID=4639 RepID=A0AAV8RSM4_ENSVE|nr:hypothetical protein OPV22_006041 [Ensete ventricosum]
MEAKDISRAALSVVLPLTSPKRRPLEMRCKSIEEVWSQSCGVRLKRACLETLMVGCCVYHSDSLMLGFIGAIDHVEVIGLT